MLTMVLNHEFIYQDVALLTCARSTAPSVVETSTTPSLRVASLASKPSTGLGIICLTSRLAKAGIRQGGE